MSYYDLKSYLKETTTSTITEAQAKLAKKQKARELKENKNPVVRTARKLVEFYTKKSRYGIEDKHQLSEQIINDLNNKGSSFNPDRIRAIVFESADPTTVGKYFNNMSEDEQTAYRYAIYNLQGSIPETNIADYAKETVKEAATSFGVDPNKLYEAFIADNPQWLAENLGAGMKKYRRLNKNAWDSGDPRDVKKRLKGSPDEFKRDVADRKGNLRGPAELQRRLAKRMVGDEEVEESRLIDPSQKPYISLTRDGYEVQDANGEVQKTFSPKEYGRKGAYNAASDWFEAHYDELTNPGYGTEPVTEDSRKADEGKVWVLQRPDGSLDRSIIGHEMQPLAVQAVGKYYKKHQRTKKSFADMQDQGFEFVQRRLVEGKIQEDVVGMVGPNTVVQLYNKADGNVIGQLELETAAFIHNFSVTDALPELRETGVYDIGDYVIRVDRNMMEDEDPCWDDYEMVGMKKKGGKKVPNCVPESEELSEEAGTTQIEVVDVLPFRARWYNNRTGEVKTGHPDVEEAYFAYSGSTNPVMFNKTRSDNVLVPAGTLSVGDTFTTEAEYEDMVAMPQEVFELNRKVQSLMESNEMAQLRYRAGLNENEFEPDHEWVIERYQDLMDPYMMGDDFEQVKMQIVQELEDAGYEHDEAYSVVDNALQNEAEAQWERMQSEPPEPYFQKAQRMNEHEDYENYVQPWREKGFDIKVKDLDGEGAKLFNVKGNGKSFSIREPEAGVYRVGSSGRDFDSFDAAMKDMLEEGEQLNEAKEITIGKFKGFKREAPPEIRITQYQPKKGVGNIKVVDPKGEIKPSVLSRGMRITDVESIAKYLSQPDLYGKKFKKAGGVDWIYDALPKKTQEADGDSNLSEKAVSRNQQQAAGMALAAKRGEMPVSDLQGAAKEMYDSMSASELEDFAETKHKGLPDKVNEDWGSSDWTAALKMMNQNIERTGKKTWDNIKQAAADVADFYYDAMGYESPDEAVPRIIQMWRIRNEPKMFAEADPYGGGMISPYDKEPSDDVQDEVWDAAVEYAQALLSEYEGAWDEDVAHDVKGDLRGWLQQNDQDWFDDRQLDAIIQKARKKASVMENSHLDMLKRLAGL